LSGELIKAVTSNPPTALDIDALLPSLLLLGICYMVAEACARGVDIVFRSIELGCNEVIGRIDRSERLEAELKQQPT